MPTAKTSEPTSAAAFLPARRTLRTLRRAARDCQGCDLFRHATQTVFGEGPEDCELMLVGEQPGDQEDLQGQPFIGPAGRLLNQLLDQVGISRDTVYVTNVVKHFKWQPRGKRRLHAQPASREIVACVPWLEAEVEVVDPRLLVCLGATAARTLLGASFRLTKQHGQISPCRWGPAALATYHPSAILRAPDERRDELKKVFETDLRKARDWLAGQRASR